MVQSMFDFDKLSTDEVSKLQLLAEAHEITLQLAHQHESIDKAYERLIQLVCHQSILHQER